MAELDERVKELNCMFAMSDIFNQQDLSIEDILRQIVDLIPPAWKYPEVTCAKITLENKDFKTKNYNETIWTLNSDINSIKNGSITVCYLEEKPKLYEGPFLKEERNLINNIAQRIGKFIDRRWAEDELMKSKKRFRDLIDCSLTGISIVRNNRVVYQNQEQERLFGALPRYAVLGDLENIHPDDVDRVKQMSQEISSGNIRSLDLAFRYYRPEKGDDSDRMVWLHCRASIIEYQGEESILVNMMDITRSKELENLLRVQDKMASLGRVAAGIAHEIRNPLSGINIYINILEKLYGKEEQQEKVKDIFRHLQSASVKIESVIRRVMDFSKPSEPKFELMDINQPIEEAIKLTAVTLRKSGITLEKALDQNLPHCLIDQQLIEEVILNLINNAADAMKSVVGERKIRISTSMKDHHICIRVFDFGPGVPEHIRNKIFDPFYTTKSESTGIGLSLCQRIITDHGGSISLNSSPWRGAEFIIEIPTVSAKNGH